QSTDKLYITRSEWAGEAPGSDGGMKFGGIMGRHSATPFKRLPFFCCAISLGPFENPYCAPDGTIFDLMNIVPFLRKYGIHPVTGEKLAMKDLIKLNFYKNPSGEFHCPVTFKPFGEHTKIVAVRPTGNVYSWEAVEELNIQPKNWKDLLSDDPFKRTDLITIQDPHNIEARSISKFYYRTHEMASGGAATTASSSSVASGAINAQGTTARTLRELEARKEEERRLKLKELDEAKVTPSHISKVALPYNAAHFSNNRMAASLTSTAAYVQTTQQRVVVDEEEYMFKRVKGPAYAAIRTSVGQLNVELFCEKAPKTCYNFIRLAKDGKYNGTVFHRSIKGFMIQGGDPTGTGKGGESFWGTPFADEIAHGLSHDARGLLSMANRGANTNNSQFFVTFGACKHLDGKHSIFGKVVGGLETLGKMEAVETDKADRPKMQIQIEDVQVFVDVSALVVCCHIIVKFHCRFCVLFSLLRNSKTLSRRSSKSVRIHRRRKPRQRQLR
ncbi:cyclophilin-like protein, partial [Gonapodya prolifera JEL478]